MTAAKHEYLAAIAAEGARMIEAIRRDPASTVPHYPEWDGRDLAAHVGFIMSRTARIARERSRERVAGDDLPAGVDAVDWAEGRLEEMLDALGQVDSEEAVWCFLPEQSIASWERRMTIEIGVHRWDAQRATGDADPLADLVAISGLDEFPVMFLERLGDVPTLRLEATDGDGRWTYGAEPATSFASGTASDLYLRLMARPGATLPDEWAAAVDAVPTAAR